MDSYLFSAHSKILQMCGKISFDSNAIIELLRGLFDGEILSFSVILFVVLRTISKRKENIAQCRRE